MIQGNSRIHFSKGSPRCTETALFIGNVNSLSIKSKGTFEKSGIMFEDGQFLNYDDIDIDGGDKLCWEFITE